MVKVLITGGAGFIGSKIAEHCLKAGLWVRVFDLARPVNPQVHEAIVGSILDPYEVSVAARGCDFVVHAAAALGVERTESRRLECLHINIQGTVNVLEACVKEDVRKVLFTSSSEVYGDGNGAAPFEEDAPLNPKSNYAITKLVGEEYMRAYRQSYGLDHAIVRFFNVYGENQTEKFVIPRFVQRVLQGSPPRVYGKGEQVRSFCHVEDAALGAVLALLSDRGGGEIFNIGNPSEPVSVRDLAGKIIELAGKSMTPEFVDFSQSDRSDGREIYWRVPSIEKARSVLGYEPRVGLEEGLRRMLRPSPVAVGSGK